MQTQFKLTAEEVKQACQAFVAKANRSRNLSVSSIEYNHEDNSVVVAAEVIAQPKQPRTKKTKTVEKKQA